jgi:hypothetical protein
LAEPEGVVPIDLRRVGVPHEKGMESSQDWIGLEEHEPVMRDLGLEGVGDRPEGSTQVGLRDEETSHIGEHPVRRVPAGECWSMSLDGLGKQVRLLPGPRLAAALLVSVAEGAA